MSICLELRESLTNGLLYVFQLLYCSVNTQRLLFRLLFIYTKYSKFIWRQKHITSLETKLNAAWFPNRLFCRVATWQMNRTEPNRTEKQRNATQRNISYGHAAETVHHSHANIPKTAQSHWQPPTTTHNRHLCSTSPSHGLWTVNCILYTVYCVLWTVFCEKCLVHCFADAYDGWECKWNVSRVQVDSKLSTKQQVVQRKWLSIENMILNSDRIIVCVFVYVCGCVSWWVLL